MLNLVLFIARSLALHLVLLKYMLFLLSLLNDAEDPVQTTCHHDFFTIPSVFVAPANLINNYFIFSFVNVLLSMIYGCTGERTGLCETSAETHLIVIL